MRISHRIIIRSMELILLLFIHATLGPMSVHFLNLGCVKIQLFWVNIFVLWIVTDFISSCKYVDLVPPVLDMNVLVRLYVLCIVKTYLFHL